MRPTALVTTALLVGVLAGCGAADDSADPATPSPPASSASPSPSSSTTPTLPSSTSTPTPPPPADDPQQPVDPRKDPRILAALEDARGRAGIVPADVVVASYSEVQWNDGSIGCPKKGQAYPQQVVDGELLLLRAGQRLLSYHSARGGAFEYCAKPSDGFKVKG